MKRILLSLVTLLFIGCTRTPSSMNPRHLEPTDFPYKQEEITFTNTKDNNNLAGTLTLPSHGKISKIVILITGSGPQDRNETVKEL
ncbi:MAG TPA: hypothetical protein VNW51_00095, partial [Mucilaginibacter sp.]|nr:hypothetical protein [Mucilaginibacter sp.]